MNQHFLPPYFAQRLPTVLLVAGLTLLTSFGLGAQGFIQRYPQAPGIGTQVFETPSGYRIRSAYALPPQTEVQHNNIYTDKDGRFLALENQPGITGHDTVMVALENGDYITAAFVWFDSVMVQRLSPTGDVLWSYHQWLGPSVLPFTYFNNYSYVPRLMVSKDGSIYVHGLYLQTSTNTADIYYLKLSAAGELLWSKILDTALLPIEAANYPHILWLHGTYDSTVLLTRYSTNATGFEYDDTLTVTRLDAAGEPLLEYKIKTHSNSTDFGILSLPDGRVAHLVHDYSAGSGIPVVRLVIYSAAGVVESQTNFSALYQTSANPGSVLSVYRMMATADGNFVFYLGSNAGSGIRHSLMKFSLSGTIFWETQLPFSTNEIIAFYDMLEFSDATLGFVGYWNLVQNANATWRPLFVKLGPNGELYPQTLLGRVVRDDDNDCLADSLETGLPGWLLRVEHPPFDYITQTDAAGAYSVPADTGAYTVTLVTPNYLWQVCDNPQTVTITPGLVPAEFTADFAVDRVAECPFMQVDVVAPQLEAGVENPCVVRYCNNGTAVAENAMLSLEFDPSLSFARASAPHTFASNTLYFELGNVAVGHCEQLELVFSAPGEEDLPGKSICFTARVTPDSICLPPAGAWSGALLDASGRCDGDSVRFTVRNVGTGNSTANLGYIIADDHVVMHQGLLPALPPGGTREFVRPADGSSWRFVGTQEPNVPAGLPPSIPIEDCPEGVLPVSGLAVQLPNATGSPFTDLECTLLQPVNTVPPLLSASPTGVGPLHLIEAGTKLDYLVQYEVGTMAGPLVVTDTLPAELDATTFVAGPTSHPYTWHFGTDGVLYLDFAPLPGGFGEVFVQFSVRAKADLPDGTMIENRVNMYAGQSSALASNLVFHTIGDPLLVDTTTSAVKPLPTIGELGLSPNPASDFATLRLPFPTAPGQMLLCRTVHGQLVWQKPVTSPVLRIEREALPAGLYFLEYWDKAAILARGKVMWQ